MKETIIITSQNIDRGIDHPQYITKQMIGSILGIGGCYHCAYEDAFESLSQTGQIHTHDQYQRPEDIECKCDEYQQELSGDDNELQYYAEVKYMEVEIDNGQQDTNHN